MSLNLNNILKSTILSEGRKEDLYQKYKIAVDDDRDQNDDDLKNVRAVEQFIEEELNKMYPEFHFVVYDTSDKGKRKMVIEKE